MDILPLMDRTALVTAAASGIGAATAARLAGAGARVVLVARRAERLLALAEELDAVAVPADITRPGDVAALRERVGDVDLLVNNAAIMLPNPVAAAAGAEWRRMLDLNLVALLEVTRVFLPGLLAPAGVRVTDVKPGGVDTELLQHATHPGIRARLAEAPQRMRLLDAADVADAITYAVTRPRHACLAGLTVVPVAQPG